MRRGANDYGTLDSESNNLDGVIIKVQLAFGSSHDSSGRVIQRLGDKVPTQESLGGRKGIELCPFDVVSSAMVLPYTLDATSR